jgi:hypothetical protein
MKLKLLISSLLILSFSITAWSQTPARTPAAKSERSKSISFEDDLVEGMNANPRDSLENLAKRDRRNQGSLYRKRLEYKKEMKNLGRDMGYTP